jgi:hypothetical protein
VRVAIVVLALMASQTALSHPVLGEGRMTPVGRCYPDHEHAGLWWLEPPPAEVRKEGDAPVALFTTFLYQGTRTTGDAGRQWGGSILQFALTFPSSAGRAERAKSYLRSASTIRALDPAEVRAEVVFAGIGDGGREARGDPGGSATGVARESTFALALSPEEGAAVRSAWEAGSVILSVNVVVSAFAFQTRPHRDADAQPELLPVSVGVVNVHLDPDDDRAFRVLSLDATMPADYTTLDIGCGEIAGGPSFADLARVVVVVSGEAVNGDRVSEEVRFGGGSSSIRTVRFNQALKLDAGYDVAVMRVYSSGAVEAQDTRHVEVWQGFIDVCSTRPGISETLDPRALF